MAKILDSHFRSPYFRFVYIIPANFRTLEPGRAAPLAVPEIFVCSICAFCYPSFNFRMEMIREKTR